MPAQSELLLEAERRGILPPNKQALLDEARRRGLVADRQPATPQRWTDGNPRIGVKQIEPGPALDDDGFRSLSAMDDVRGEISGDLLERIDGGQDTPELRSAVQDARDRLSGQHYRRGDRADDQAVIQQGRGRRANYVAAIAGGVQNAATLGLGDRINAGLARAGDAVTGQGDRHAERDGSYLTEARSQRGELQEDHPYLSLGGEVAGYLAPGAATWKAGSAAAKAVGSRIGASRILPQGTSRAARGGRYAARLAPVGAIGAVDAAVYGATAAASNEEVREDRSLSAAERVDVGKSYAPFGAAAPVALSAVYRAGVGAGNAGRNFTPNRVATEVNLAHGVPLNTTGQETALALDAIATGGDVSRGTARSLLTILESSGLPSDRIRRGVIEAHDIVKRAGQDGERLPLFADALGRAFREAPEVANNLQQVLRQLQSSGPRQGNAPSIVRQGLERQSETQGQHLDDVFQRELGDQSAFDERKILEATRSHQADIGYEQALRRIDTTSRNPNVEPLRQGLREKAAQYGDVLGSESRLRGHATIDDFITNEPAHAAHVFQSKLRSAGAFEARSAGEEVLDLLERASLFVKTRSGSHRRLPESEYRAARNLYRQQSQQLEAADFGQKLLTRVKDGQSADEMLYQLRQMDPEARRLAALSIKEGLTNVFRGTNSDELIKALPTLNQLRKAGLHNFLEDSLGESGKRISQAIQRTLDERAFLKGARPEVLGQSPSARQLAEARRLYTPNPIARAAERLPWRNAFMADVGTGVTGLPSGYATGFKAVGTALGPGRTTREELAKLLTQSRVSPLRPRQPRTPAPNAAVPAQPYRDGRGRIQRGAATPAAQAERPREAGLVPKLAERQAQQAPSRPVGSQGTLTREEVIRERQRAVTRPSDRSVGQPDTPAQRTPKEQAKLDARIERDIEQHIKKVEQDIAKRQKPGKKRMERLATAREREEQRLLERQAKDQVEQLKRARRAARNASIVRRLDYAIDVLERSVNIGKNVGILGGISLISYIMYKVHQLTSGAYNKAVEEVLTAPTLSDIGPIKSFNETPRQVAANAFRAQTQRPQ